MRRGGPIPGGLASVVEASQPAHHRALGDSHRDAKRWAEAAAAYCRHLETRPDDTAIWIQAGNCFKEAGNFARSLAAYRKAEELEPGNFEVHLQLGHLYKLGRNFSASLAAYEKAAALHPDFGEIRHEIRDLVERIKTAPVATAIPVAVVGSIEEVLAAFRELPAGEDPFAAYFRSIGGYAIEPEA